MLLQEVNVLLVVHIVLDWIYIGEKQHIKANNTLPVITFTIHCSLNKYLRWLRLHEMRIGDT